MSYNVNFALCRGGLAGEPERLVARALLSSGADLVLLQEVHSGWASFLSPLLSPSLPHSRWLHDEVASGGLAVLSAFPVARSWTVEPRRGGAEGAWFPAAVHVVAAPGRGPVAVANVHLRPALEEDGTATMMTMAKTSPVRVAEVGVVLQHMPQGMPWVLAGDFNENDEYSACRMLREMGLQDALQLTKKHTHWWVLRQMGNMVLRKRLDHLFSTPQLRAVACDVLDGYEGNASDHLPVVADFELEHMGLEDVSEDDLRALAIAMAPGEEKGKSREELEELLQAMFMSQQ